jgi:ABC-type transport system substrate-binding protein
MTSISVLVKRGPLSDRSKGAYMATTFLGKFEGMAMGPNSNAWEPDSVLYGLYAPDQPRNSGHVNDPQITPMLQEQRRTKDLEARKKIIFDIQRRAAEQQYYVYTSSNTITASWKPYVKNFAPNNGFDYGNRSAALWLDRQQGGGLCVAVLFGRACHGTVREMVRAHRSASCLSVRWGCGRPAA